MCHQSNSRWLVINAVVTVTMNIQFLHWQNLQFLRCCIFCVDVHIILEDMKENELISLLFPYYVASCTAVRSAADVNIV